MHVCIHVCMYVRISICMNECMCVRIYATLLDCKLDWSISYLSNHLSDLHTQAIAASRYLTCPYVRSSAYMSERTKERARERAQTQTSPRI